MELGLEPKAVLVLANCSAHPDETELISKDGKVIAKYLPPNVTSLIQPMDQGVLESLKRRYRRKILEELIFQDEEGTTIPDYLKRIKMLKVSNLIGACWDEIPNKTFQLSWSKIIPSSREVMETPDMADISRAQTTGTEEQACTSEAAMEFQTLFEQLGQTLSEDEVSEWISSDLNDQGYVHLSEDEIIASIVHQEEQHEEESDNEDSQQDQGAKISHSMAVKMFDQWLQQQEEASLYDVGAIREMRDFAARKRINSFKQKKLPNQITHKAFMQLHQMI